ncbi:MAG: calcium-binding protein [Rubrivivax sp.]
MAVSVRYSTRGTLGVQGDALSNAIDLSRDVAGTLFVNGGALPVVGGPATMANTRLFQVTGADGDDSVTMNEALGPLPRAILAGGNGNDALSGASGDDLLQGDAGDDLLRGQGGTDLLYGGAGLDVLQGGPGNDFLVGGGDGDQLFGGDGDDRLVWNAGDGADLFEGGAGTDTTEVNGGAGSETFTMVANGLRVRIDRFDPADPAVSAIDAGTMEVAVFNLQGGDDQFSAGNGLATLVALTVDGGTGNDTIRGSDGADRLLGGDGDDVVDGQRGADSAWLGAGNDLFQWDPGDGSDVVEGQDGSDTLLFNGANIGEAITLGAAGARALFFRNIANVTMDLDDVEGIHFNALGGADTVTVNDMAGTDVTRVEIDLAATIGGSTGDGAADSVVAHGGGGVDTVDVVGAGGTVSVLGLAARIDVLHAEVANDALVVSGLGGDDRLVATTLPAGQIRLTLDGGDGHDTLRGSQGADLFLGGAGNDLVLGDGGNDVALLGADDDVFEWEPGDGSDVVEGQDGHDTLRFFGSNAAEVIGIVANGARVLLQRDVAAVTMDLNEVEHVDMRALGGADAITIGDLAGTAMTRIDLDLAGALGGGDGATDTVAVTGTLGDDSIAVTADAGGIHVAGLQATVHVATFDGADRLTINAQAGNDVVNASTLAAGAMALAINGGLGNDLMVGGAGGDRFNGGDGNDTALMGAGDDTFTWNPGDDNDIVEGQAGTDTLLFNGANVAELITIMANGGRAVFLRNIANVVMDLNDTEVIHFNALGGADTVTVNDLSGTDVTRIEINLAAAGGAGDGAADTVVVNATAGDDVVVVTGDAGGVSILGLAAQIDLVGFEAGTDRIVVNLLAGDDVLEASGLAASGPLLTGNGGEGNDVLIGGDGNDALNGDAGDDVLIGGPGNDVLDGGLGDNVVIQLVGATIAPAATI